MLVVVLCCLWKCVSAAVSGLVHIPEVPGCHLFYDRLVPREGNKNYLKDHCDFFLILTFFGLTQLTIISKLSETDNFESHNSLKFSFTTTNVQGLHSNFVGCESLFESNSPDILALYGTNFYESID